MTGRSLRILFRLTSIVLTLAAIACIVYFIPSFDSRWRGVPDYGEIYRFDPAREGGHLLPGLDMWVRGSKAGKPVRIVTNSKGFRSRKEFAQPAPEGTYRILLMGDSFVDGMRTDQDDTIGAVLESFLKSHSVGNRYTDCEVMISGHNNPADAWFYYQQHGTKYGPHLVILGITLGNDLTWAGYRLSILPVASADGGTRLHFENKFADIVAVNRAIMLPPGAFEPASTWDLCTDAEMRMRKFLANRFAFAGSWVAPPTEPWTSRRGIVYAADFTLSLGIFHQPLMAEAEGWFRNLEDVLAGLNHDVAGSAARFLVVIFPTRLQVNAPEWKMAKRAYGLKESAFDLDYPDDRIVAHCRRLDIPCLDELETFRSHARTEEGPLYRSRGDMHFNEAGQRLAAVTLGEHILRSNLR